MRDQVGAEMQESQTHNVAILACSGGQKFQWIAAERAEHPIKRARFRSRRKFRRQRALHVGMLIARHSVGNATSFPFEIKSTPAAWRATASRHGRFRRWRLKIRRRQASR